MSSRTTSDSASADIVIVGGGITGAAAAYWLASEGHKPLLLEANSIAAMGSGWSLGGVRQSGRDPAELPLAQAAIALWPTLGDRLGGDVEYRQRGNVRLARTEPEVAVIRHLVEDQRRLGLALDFLPRNVDVRAMAPSISESVLAASYCPTDGHANPARTTQAFAAAAQRLGASIREGVTVHGVRTQSGRVIGVDTSDGFIATSRVVAAAGIRTPGLLAQLGLTLPLDVQIVSVLQTAAVPPCLDQVFGVANADCAGRQEVGGSLRVTSGIGPWPGDPARWQASDRTPQATEIERLRDLIGAVLPVLRSAPIAHTWGGLIDLTPDALPVIDCPGALEGLVVAAGFSGHGFGIGPVTGQLVCDLVLDRAPRHDITAFRLARFETIATTQASLTLHG